MPFYFYDLMGESILARFWSLSCRSISFALLRRLTMKALSRAILILMLAAETLLAQRPSNGQGSTQPENKTPALTLSVNVVERTTKAINYRHRSGATTVDFKGTSLMPAA